MEQGLSVPVFAIPIGEEMKFLCIALVAMLVIPSFVLASGETALSSINVTIVGGQGIIVNTERYWQQSDTNNGFLTGGNQYNEGTTDTVFVTAKGTNRFDMSESTNHSLDNVLDSAVVAQSNDGFVFGHGIYMGDQQPAVPDLECEAGNLNKPSVDANAGQTRTFVKGTNPSHQEVLIEKYGVGQGVYIESDIIAENANVTSSTRGEVGLGLLAEDIFTDAEVGFDKNDTNSLNYQKFEKNHFVASGGELGNGRLDLDFKWRDHSHVYGIGADEGEVYTVNVTNTTESNLTNST